MEAVDAHGKTFANFELSVESDTVVSVIVYGWRNRMMNGQPLLTPDHFQPKSDFVQFNSFWRYHSGDSARWREPDFADHDWPVANTQINWDPETDPEWHGIGWFRLSFCADTTLWHKTVAIRILHLGASEIYYNGRLLYRFGTVHGTPSLAKPVSMSWWQEIKFDPRRDHVLAVRYANHDWKKLSIMGYQTGFIILLADANRAFQQTGVLRENAVRQTIFIIVPLVLFFLHLSLYSFSAKQRRDLFYAIAMLGFAGVTYFNYEKNVIVDVSRILLYTKLNSLSVSITLFAGILLLYQSYYKMPRRIWFYTSWFSAAVILDIFFHYSRIISAANYLLVGFLIAEGVLLSFKKEVKPYYGGWIMFAGFVFMHIFIVLQILIDYSLLTSFFGETQVYVYGVLGLAVATSISLSYNFARVNSDLEQQVLNVKKLSEQTLAQQQHAHQLELERKSIEAENERKNRELEAATQLQLSLLPKRVPQSKGADIAALMKAATEVGGDYYDFFEAEDGTLTIALGDATGHGLNAGNLVTATKALLQLLADSQQLEDILFSANRAIKRMKLHRLTMCLSLVRIGRHTLQYASAGMPPILLFRAEAGRCEQHVLKAMPLGALDHFPFQCTELHFGAGDILVMMSDGLLDLFNEKGEQYSLEQVMASIESHAAGQAQEIIDAIYGDGKAWAGTEPLRDDLTIVVMKMPTTYQQSKALG